MPSVPIAACGQLCATADFQANLDTCENLAKEAGKAGASVLLLPECFAFLGERERDKFGIAEHISMDQPGVILSSIMDWAADNGLWVIAGGLPELAPGETRESAQTAYNTVAVVSPDRKLVSTYRKIHLFDVELADGTTLKESSATAPGSDLACVETPIGTLGLSICYDLRFPELYRKLALQMGAKVLVVPAAFTAQTGPAHWHALLRARAIENQCWVLAAAQSGRHNEKRASYGHSLIIDPWGKVCAELPEGSGVITFPIDPEVTKARRSQLPSLKHVVLKS
jgi:predicted amidohydrolase